MFMQTACMCRICRLFALHVVQLCGGYVGAFSPLSVGNQVSIEFTLAEKRHRAEELGDYLDFGTGLTFDPPSLYCYIFCTNKHSKGTVRRRIMLQHFRWGETGDTKHSTIRPTQQHQLQ